MSFSNIFLRFESAFETRGSVAWAFAFTVFSSTGNQTRSHVSQSQDHDVSVDKLNFDGFVCCCASRTVVLSWNLPKDVMVMAWLPTFSLTHRRIRPDGRINTYEVPLRESRQRGIQTRQEIVWISRSRYLLQRQYQGSCLATIDGGLSGMMVL